MFAFLSHHVSSWRCVLVGNVGLGRELAARRCVFAFLAHHVSSWRCVRVGNVGLGRELAARRCAFAFLARVRLGPPIMFRRGMCTSWKCRFGTPLFHVRIEAAS